MILQKIVLAAAVMSALSASTFAQSVEDFEISQNQNGTIIITNYSGTERDVVIPDTINGIDVTNIGYNAFKNKRLTSLNLPARVTVIGEFALADNELTSIEIPDGVVSIGNSAFAGNQLTDVRIPNSVKTIHYGAFARNPLTTLSISDKVVSIIPRVFAANQVNSITLGEKVEIYTGNFDPSFVNYYISQKKKAGRYIKKDRVWTLE
ncbi:leucine-rich repeat domain-containing protein [Breznakiellaceae bacterium SP9]